MKKSKLVALLLVIVMLSNVMVPFSNIFAVNNKNFNKTDFEQIKLHALSEEEYNSLKCTKTEENFSPSMLYAFSRNSYASTYGYNRLDGENKKKAYQMLQYASYIFHTSEDDVEELYSYYPAMEINVEECNLAIDEAEKVYLTFYYDNPEYYWLDAISYYYNKDTGKVLSLVLNVKAEYAKANVRNSLTKEIEKNIENYLNLVSPMSTDYEKELIIHDALVYFQDYAYNSKGEPEDSAFAHNIVGVFDDDENTKPVCEGYAKAFLLLMSASGIDCGFVAGLANGGGHAWNQVKLDNEWYNVDVTWDDPGGDYTYYGFFNITDAELRKTHTPFSSKNPSYSWCYDTFNSTATKYSYENQKENVPNISLANTVTYDSTEQIPICVFNQGVEVASGAKVLPNTKLNISILSKDIDVSEYYMLDINGERIPIKKIADANGNGYVEYGVDYTAISGNMEFSLVEKSDEDFNLVLNKKSITFDAKGNTDKLEVTFKGKTIDSNTLKFVSDNSYVARVSANGIITSVNKGKATIKVVSEKLSKEVTCDIIGDMPYLLGDIDNNGEVEITDAYSLLRFVVSRMDLSSIHSSILPAANFSNSDEEIDITDAYLLVRHIVKNM